MRIAPRVGRTHSGSSMEIRPGRHIVHVASYHAPAGHHAADPDYFLNARDNAPLRAPSSDESGGNGTFSYDLSNPLPNRSVNAFNYWVDVLFEVNP
jgi:hypothetical protein